MSAIPGTRAEIHLLETRGFVLDLERCTGCHACALACSTENELGFGRSWRQLVTFNDERLPGIPSYHLSLACNHCEEAPCLTQCPALAIDRDAKTGTVQIDSARCIGCRYCAWVCPYDAPRFDAAHQVMTKCTGCSHRLEEGRPPACVEQCPTAALDFGSLHGEETVPGFPVTPARPALRFLRPTRERRPPETTWQPDPDLVESFLAARPEPEPDITLRGEWPLLIFTLLLIALVGWVAASLAGSPAPAPALFLAAAGIAAATSTLHLGRRARAWRAVLNVRRSWLSREIAAFGGFALSALPFLITDNAWWGAAAIACGVAALFAVDRVYDPVRPLESRTLHSADAVLTAVALFSLLVGDELVMLVTAATKVALYAGRKLRFLRCGRPARGILSALRLGVGLVLPALLWFQGGGEALAAALVAFALGELIDRAEFYTELSRRTPRDQARRDVAAVWTSSRVPIG